jgi:pimeloyl-ACP methyl ester carboxylesterase
MRWVKRIGLLVGGLLVLAAGFVGFCGLSYWHHMRVDESRGINESGYVRIGGIDQWVQIRGEDRNNPVLLWLNGGPGFTTIDDTYWYRQWEQRYTVVMWDQRGEGKSFDRSGPSIKDTMSIAQLTKDGAELAEYLTRRLQKRKIILLGHSWGSVLGVHMVHARPDLFSVYVGTGQLASERQTALASYPLVLERARLHGNKQAEQDLLAAGAPPYPEDVRAWIPLLTWAQTLDPRPIANPPPSAGSLWLRMRRFVRFDEIAPGITPAVQFSMFTLWPDLLKDDLRSLGSRFDVPVVFIQGAEDITTVTALAKDYFDGIEAPSKRFVSLAGAGHLAIFTDREGFLRTLDEHARPFAEP